MARRSAQTRTPLLLTLLAIVAGIALSLSRGGNRIDSADLAATIEGLRHIADAADHQERATGAWPTSRDHGPTPLGGRYTWTRTGMLAAVVIENATPDKLAAWHAIDQQIDDGDLSGGWVFWRDERLTWVLEEE